MPKLRTRSEDIRGFVLKHAGEDGLAAQISQKFDISRQAANRHLKTLTTEGVLLADGQTRQRSYKVAATASASFSYAIQPGLAEDIVWRKDIQPFLGPLPDNVREVWNYAFTEMFNNAIDHSAGVSISVSVTKSAVATE